MTFALDLLVALDALLVHFRLDGLLLELTYKLLAIRLLESHIPMPALEAFFGSLEVLLALQPVFLFDFINVAVMCFVAALLHLSRR